ncbi:hypothetical protein CTEN210_02138 [Chaetoceros tenuissimus]|uniref:CBF1-interacting co-repressor CIR N-terminal domain-containing protein n=1 Tax=Chaetoceros tenuissimus TaxID=426638 RepID=A0AAD3H0S5_9STRA|nr:hypothetical protein CTEN210_02138 [Chaetoceros tenuissimus]
MVQGLKFLSKKSFNPQNLSNQKRTWEREQEQKREEARLRERERQLVIERDHEELARSRDGTSGGQKASLRFMYDQPSSLDAKKKDDELEGINDSTKSNGDEVESFRKAGDDDAAAAFRRMLAGVHEEQEEKESETANDLGSSLIISGSTAEANATEQKRELTQLEKAVGKRNGMSSLTYEEQISRFPQLKNAPIAIKRKGKGEEDDPKTNLNFKPLGAQIRNVRCLACKIWGHQKGDRECKLSGWDPFSSSSMNAMSAIPSSSIMPDSKRPANGEKQDDHGYYGPSKTEDRERKRQNRYHSDSDSEDSRDRQRRRKKKSSRRKDSRRDRSDRKRTKSERSRRRDYDSDHSSDFSRDYERRRRDRKRKKEKRRRRDSRSRSRSPSSRSR